MSCANGGGDPRDAGTLAAYSAVVVADAPLATARGVADAVAAARGAAGGGGAAGPALFVCGAPGLMSYAFVDLGSGFVVLDAGARPRAPALDTVIQSLVAAWGCGLLLLLGGGGGGGGGGGTRALVCG